MLVRLVASAAVGATLLHGVAFAQSSSATSSTQSTAQSIQTLPQELKQKLEHQGFTNVEVVPGSFIVSAKDKQGDPVTMIIGPNSLTMFSISTANTNSATGVGSTTGSGSSSSGNKK